MKAIVTTSANPFHYGHLGLYDEACKIFNKNNVKVAIGKNANKSIDFDRIRYHLTPYNIRYDVAENITLADYCKKNKIDYIVRGIRNSVDAEYELKLDFLNKEINSELQTMFFPTRDIFSNISSSSINELLKYNKFDVAKKYMNEDAMYRFINKKPKYVVFFGKSCTGKTYYLNNIARLKTVDVDKIFWDIFSECYGESLMPSIKEKSLNCVRYNKSMDDLIKKYSTEEFWITFFNYVDKHFKPIDVKLLTTVENVIALDFPSIGIYWNTIPPYLRGKLYLIKLEKTDRIDFIKSKHFEDKIEYLDKSYKDPTYYDDLIRL